MYDSYLENKARKEFNKAKNKVFILKMLNILTPEKLKLLSLNDVFELVKPKNARYTGLKVVEVSHIVGSEGRYQDFNKTFLPKYEYLRVRWENINKAYSKDIALPPVHLYEIGGIYFVRDGNHRVSVARAIGQEMIDAEVTSLSSEIDLHPKMTRNDLKEAIINYEKKCFYRETGLHDIIPENELNFTATGRYEEIINHINGHKYYLNLNSEDEMSFKEAARSWYENLFKPVIRAINENKILTFFNKRTSADLYAWIIKLWDELKKQENPDLSIEDTVNSLTKDYKRHLFNKVKKLFTGFFKKK